MYEIIKLGVVSKILASARKIGCNHDSFILGGPIFDLFLSFLK